MFYAKQLLGNPFTASGNEVGRVEEGQVWQPAASGEDNGKGLAGGAEMAFRFNTVLLLRSAIRFSETTPSVAVTSLR